MWISSPNGTLKWIVVAKNVDPEARQPVFKFGFGPFELGDLGETS